jgi:hypothetical protein
MKEISWTVIILINSLVAAAALFGSYVTHNKKTLRQKGFSSEYINLLQKQQKQFTAAWIVLFIGLQVLAWFIVKKYVVITTLKIYVKYILNISILASLPIGFYFFTRFSREARELAIKTGSKIVIDFKFKILHSMFRLPLEIVASLLIVYCAIFPFKGVTILHLYAALPWFYYIGLRISKNQNRPLFRFKYQEIGKWSIIISLLTVFLLVVEFQNHLEKMNLFDRILCLTTLVVVGAKALYYIIKYKSFKKSAE